MISIEAALKKAQEELDKRKLICPHCGKEDIEWYEQLDTNYSDDFGDFKEVHCHSCDNTYQARQRCILDFEVKK